MTKKSVKKKSTQKKTVNATEKEKPVEPSLIIIHTSKCQTVSNKSTLTYNIAVDDKEHVFIRINNNTGGGFFSNEWVSLDRITTTLKEVPADSPITSIHLFPLFKGKSVNSPGYLLAVLVNEGILTSFQGKKRQYVYSGVDVFLAKIDKQKAAKKTK